MKKIIFLVIIIFSFVVLPCLSQPDELNRVTLSPKESKEYLDTLESTWTKVKNLPKKMAWTFDNITRTMGKVINDTITGKKIYVLTVDKKANFDDGSIISSLQFEVIVKDKEWDVYFPLETVTFYYNHNLKKGLAIYVIKNFHDDSAFHEKTPIEIRKKIKEFIRKINKLFI